jgi:murein L,D-transpeptidase YcbB/YkuD
LWIETDRNGNWDKIRQGNDYIPLRQWLRQNDIEKEDFFARVSPTPENEDTGQPSAPAAEPQHMASSPDTSSPDTAEPPSMIEGTTTESDSMVGDPEVAGAVKEGVELAPGMGITEIDPVTKERPFDERVVKLQNLLKERNIPLGPDGVDGYFGPDTEKALIQFQSHNGLAPTGVLNEQTIRLLEGE